jgi:hypothetical protein
MLCYVNYIQSHSIAVNSKYQVYSIYAVPVSMSLASLSRCVCGAKLRSLLGQCGSHGRRHCFPAGFVDP